MLLVTDGLVPLCSSILSWSTRKGHDNTVADALSQVTTQLDPDTVKSILHGVAMGSAYWAEVHGPPHSWGWPLVRARGTCHCRPCATTNACYWLDWSPEGGPDVEHSLGLAEGTEEDRFEGTSERTCLQWRRLADLTESAEFHNSSGSPIPKRWDWRPFTLHSP